VTGTTAEAIEDDAAEFEIEAPTEATVVDE